jgi:hypothetical protein
MNLNHAYRLHRIASAIACGMAVGVSTVASPGAAKGATPPDFEQVRRLVEEQMSKLSVPSVAVLFRLEHGDRIRPHGATGRNEAGDRGDSGE